jgi:hypothetical protein
MTNHDNDQLLRQFFSEATSQPIADDGFTDRVMQRIADHHPSSIIHHPSPFALRTVTRLWTLFCIVVFAVLFVWFRGWEQLAVHFDVMLRTMAVQPLSINLSVLFAVVFGLLFVGTGEVISSESARG